MHTNSLSIGRAKKDSTKLHNVKFVNKNSIPRRERLLFYFLKTLLLVCFSLNNFMWCLKLDAPCDPKIWDQISVTKTLSLKTFKGILRSSVDFWWETFRFDVCFSNGMVTKILLFRSSKSEVHYPNKTCLYVGAQVADVVNAAFRSSFIFAGVS